MLLVRVVLGVLMLYYGLQDVFGLLGGEGFAASAANVADTFGVAVYLGQVAIIGRLVAGVFLIIGLATRFAASLVALLMTVAAVIGAQSTESLVKTTSSDPLAAVGYPVTLVVMSFVLIFLGGGLLALDSKLFAAGRASRAKAQEA